MIPEPTPPTSADLAQHPRTETAHFMPLTSIRPSPYNPRKRFDAGRLEELADMISRQGVLQPILVRLVPPVTDGGATHEIVAGERRWRASRLLVERGFPPPHVIPAFVRDLDDFDAREVALTENSGRDDLHPLEQAQAYQNLLLHPVGGGAFEPPRLKGYTVDQLADHIGHKPNFVFGRLKLLELIPAAQEAFLADTLKLKVAEALARMPAKEQEHALPELLRGWGGEPYTHRQALKHLHDNYMLKLGKAVFPIDDASLVAKAGACTDCPKRSSASPALFADVVPDDMCLDSDCHAAKVNAHTERQLDNARAAGLTVVTGDAARKLLGGYGSDASDYLLGNTGHVNLANPYPELTGTRKPLRELLGEGFLPATMVQTDGDAPITIAAAYAVKAALKSQGQLQPSTQNKPGGSIKPISADHIKAQRPSRIEKLLGKRIHTALAKHFQADGCGGFPAESKNWLHSLANILWHSCEFDNPELRMAVTGSKDIGIGRGWFDGLDTEALARAVMMMVLADTLFRETSAEVDCRETQGLADDINFDLLALRADVSDEVDTGIRIEIEALGDAAPPPPKKTKSPSKPMKAAKTGPTQQFSAAAQGNTQPPAKAKRAKPVTPLQALEAAFKSDADQPNSQEPEQIDETAKPSTTGKITLSPEGAWPFPKERW